MAFAETKTEIDRYVAGKTWYWYGLAWVFGLYAFYRILGFSYDKQQPFFIMVPQAFDFTLHELAHIVTAFLPPVMTAASGSFSELLLGVLLIFVAFRTRGYFSVLVCALWFMLACQSAGLYMADARSQHMDLVSLGGAMSGSETVIHDWNFIFGQLHLLAFDRVIGGMVRGVGVLAGLAGMAFTAWLVYRMAAAKDIKPEPSSLETRLLERAKYETKPGSIYPTPVEHTAPAPAVGKTNGQHRND